MAESHSTDGQSGDDAEDRRRSRSAELLSKADLFGVDGCVLRVRVTLAGPAALFKLAQIDQVDAVNRRSAPSTVLRQPADRQERSHTEAAGIAPQRPGTASFFVASDRISRAGEPLPS
jgi:hypothetical protein